MTPWTIPPMWAGQTVAVIGNADSATPEAIAELAGIPMIAANAAVRRAPGAAMLVSLDGNWPKEAEAFEGIKVVGVPCDLDAYFIGIDYDVAQVSPSECLHIRNNVLWAMRIAVAAGAKKLIVLGVDPAGYEALDPRNRGLVAAFPALVAKLAAAGVEVEVRTAPAPLPPSFGAKFKGKRS